MWLPPGGHIEPDEHPLETARRELAEELGVVDAEFDERPAFLTVTRTIGIDAGHPDVSLWFVAAGQRAQRLTADRREFRRARWWSRAEVDADVLVRLRFSSTDPGQVTGYSVGLAGHTTGRRATIWYGGWRLAPDLTPPRLRRRWTGPVGSPAARLASQGSSAPPAEVFLPAANAVKLAVGQMAVTTDGRVASTIARAAADLVTAAADVWEGRNGGPLTESAEQLDRAASDRIRAATVDRASQVRELRWMARMVALVGRVTDDRGFVAAMRLVYAIAAFAEHLGAKRRSDRFRRQWLVEWLSSFGRTGCRSQIRRCRLDRPLQTAATEAALSVAGLIDDVVEDREARGIVVADIVECWCRLPRAVRRQYGGRPGISGVAGFGGDYVEAVDRHWRAAIDVESFTLHDSVIKELGRLGWSIHVAQAQWRKILGQPPTAEWLASFS